jgi:hypothetical protein
MGSHTQSLWTSAAGTLDESDQSLLTFDQDKDEIKDQSALDISDSLTPQQTRPTKLASANDGKSSCLGKRTRLLFVTY